MAITGREKVIKNRNKRVFAVYMILSFFVVFVMADQIINKNYYNAFLCAFTMLLFYLPSLIDRKLNIKLPGLLEVMIIVFIFCAQILGEIKEFYLILPYWDTVLHVLNGIIMSAIGFALVDILNMNEKLKFSMSPVYVAVVAFCFSMTVGVVWEFFEFGADIIAGTDMQKDTVLDAVTSVHFNPDGKNKPVRIDRITQTVITYLKDGKTQQQYVNGYLDTGLTDTMWDMIVNFAGALAFCVTGFFYIKNRGKGNIVKRLIPQIRIYKEKNLR